MRAREKVKATRKCRGEAERESSELNLIFFSARGETEVSLSLPATQLSAAAPSQGRSLLLSLSVSLFLLSSNQCLSLSLSAFPSVSTCLSVGGEQQVANKSAAANPTRNLRRKKRN